MSAAYDTYDYPSYWIGREYEHKAEVIALKNFLAKIKKIRVILEIGAGFGRLVDSYSFRAKKVIITDPSSKLLKIARLKFNDKKRFKFIHSSLENLPQKIRRHNIDLIVLIRVIHHLQNLETSIKIINHLLKKNGYLILEYPNKRNLKAVIKAFLRGNFTFPIDIFTDDLRSKKSKKKKTLPFLNYHPDKIEIILKEAGFKIIEKRSVSNLRSTFLKKIFATDTLLYFETIFQKPFSYFYLGPSIFLLAQKKDNCR